MIDPDVFDRLIQLSEDSYRPMRPRCPTTVAIFQKAVRARTDYLRYLLSGFYRS
ncbi:hypothetical protein [Halorubrum saccharovorum]|uniref:hypothetical protein n=1 Tax=Halorubrum saccharovorum TaxID=2248 RepID=UPI000A946E8D|nr:hypothetical protein [Halorubrum saccharovorum]